MVLHTSKLIQLYTLHMCSSSYINCTSIKLFLKSHYYKNEKTSHALGENICKTQSWWRTCIQNIQRILKTQQQEKKKTIEKRAKDVSRPLTKEDIDMAANKHMTWCSPSLAIRGKPTKIIMRFHYIPIKIAEIQNTDNTKSWWGHGPKETHSLGFPGGTVVKNLPASAGNMGSSPGLGRSHMPWSNYACAPQLLSLNSRAREPQLPSPRATTTETCAPRARAPQQEKPPPWEACTLQRRVAPTRHN